MKSVLNLWVVALAYTCLSLVPCKVFAEPSAGPVTVVSHVDIKPDEYLPQSQETAARLFHAENTATQQDPGLLSFVILQEVNSPNHFTLIGTWRDLQSYQRHEGAPHTVKFRQAIQPFLGSPFDSRLHQQFR
jgi:quinol monooxygenase YgiN